MATITAPRSAPQKADSKLNGTVNGAIREPSPSPANLSWGNAGPLSLLAFAVVTLMLSLINAKAITTDVTPVVFGVGLIFGGSTQLIGGLIQLRRGDTFQGVLFASFGAFWISLAAILQWYLKEVPAAQVGHALGLLLYGFLPLVVVLWAASFRTSRVVVVALTTVLATFVFLAVGNYGGHTTLIQIGGYTGIVAAGLAFYLALAELCEYSYGRAVLPVWSLAKT